MKFLGKIGVVSQNLLPDSGLDSTTRLLMGRNDPIKVPKLVPVALIISFKKRCNVQK